MSITITTLLALIHQGQHEEMPGETCLATLLDSGTQKCSYCFTWYKYTGTRTFFYFFKVLATNPPDQFTTSEMIHHHGVSPSKQQTADLLICHDTRQDSSLLHKRNKPNLMMHMQISPRQRQARYHMTVSQQQLKFAHYMNESQHVGDTRNEYTHESSYENHGT